MAITLNGTSQYLSTGSTPILDDPCTISAWIYPTNVTVALQSIFTITQAASINPYILIRLRGDLAGDPLQVSIRNNVLVAGEATTTTGVTVNTWHHACGVFASNTSRTVYIDGGSAGTDSTSVSGSMGTFDQMAIGIRLSTSPNFRFYGGIGEVGLWSVGLTSAEVAFLALGYSPLLVRPESLVGYWPLLDKATPSIDLVGGRDMAWANSPTVATHPRVLRPAGLWTGFTGGGTAPTAPSGLTATTASSSQIDCAWTDNSDNEDNFELDYDTSAAFDSPATTVEPAANATSYNVTGLSASTLYYFRIRAVNAFGNSAYTATASDTTDASSGSLLSLFAPGMTGGLQTMSGGFG